MKQIGLARLGRDAEVRYLQDGTAVANLSLAYVCGQKKPGETYPPTQWIDATLWGKQAETLAPFLRSGSVHCFTLSDVCIRKYQGQNGEGHKLVARVDSVELGPRVGDAQQGQQQPAQRAQSPAPAPSQRQQAPAPAAPPKSASGFSDMDDDIPF